MAFVLRRDAGLYGFERALRRAGFGLIAGADEASSHGPGNERSCSEPPRSRHPRDVRIMPKSRDFH